MLNNKTMSDFISNPFLIIREHMIEIEESQWIRWLHACSDVYWLFSTLLFLLFSEQIAQFCANLQYLSEFILMQFRYLHPFTEWQCCMWYKECSDINSHIQYIRHSIFAYIYMYYDKLLWKWNLFLNLSLLWKLNLKRNIS